MTQSKVDQQPRSFGHVCPCRAVFAVLATWVIAGMPIPAGADESADDSKAWTIEIVPRKFEPRVLADAGGLQEQIALDGPTITPLVQAPTFEQERPSATIEPNSQETESEDAPAADAAPALPDGAWPLLPEHVSLYKAIYKSIPFSRAEYMANPGYRHQATMSLLMGQPYFTGAYQNYVPKTMTSFPARLYRTRLVFGYQPTYWSTRWGYPYDWRPYWGF